MLKHNAWTDGRRLLNPGKVFFFRLAAEVVPGVNAQRDADCLTYARKALIICGIALNTNGKWEEGQLKPELQQIINKHRYILENQDE